MQNTPNAKVILCYGDSNTRGNSPTGERYPIGVRWTSILQDSLGTDYAVIEEGLGGRTTALDDLPDRPAKNGKVYLLPCLESYNPIDIVILMLGTNDLKERFNQSPEQIAQNVEDLIKTINQYGKTNAGTSPKIMLLSPPHVDETVPSTQSNYKGAEEKSKNSHDCTKTLQRNMIVHS